MPAGLHLQPARAKREMDVGIGLEEVGRDAQKSCLGRGELEVVKQGGGDQLIDEDTRMLRIIAEFDHVPTTVVGFQKVRLRASSHFADVPDCGQRHGCSNLEF